jgi:hypothetical protein
MRTMKTFIAIFLFLACALGCQAATTPQVKVVIIDAATGAPIKGARADYSVEAWEGSFSGRRGKPVDLFRVRGESNAKGEITFAPKAFSDVSFGLFGMNNNYGGPTLSVYAEGYEPLNWVGRLLSKNLREASEWEFKNPMAIRLRPILAPLPDKR